MKPHITLILGGARSGKSSSAQRMAEDGGQVLFVATAEALDREMERRIEAHRRSRLTGWDTLEEPRELVSALRPLVDGYDIVLVDCITMWASNLLLRSQDPADGERRLLSETRGLISLMEASLSAWILVSNEVGLGLVPTSPLGRAYRDALGRVNQLLARRADRVELMVAGLALEIAAR